MNTYGKGMIFHFDGFNDSIGSSSADENLAAGCVDGLVMEAVGIGSFSTDAMKNTAGFKRNSMGDVAAPDGALHMRQRSSRNKSVILINGSAQGGI